MKKAIISFSALAFGLLSCAPALPRTREHPVGRPVHASPDWPAGLAELLNRPGRVYGYIYFSGNRFHYAGDTDEVNEFLAQYAMLKDTPLTLVLHAGPDREKKWLETKKIGYDWKVDVAFRSWSVNQKKRQYNVTVQVWLGGQVELGKMKVPLNIQVKSGAEGDKDGDIGKFIAAHETKRKSAEQGEAGTEPTGGPAASDGPQGARPSSAGSSGTAQVAEQVVPRSDKPLYAKVALNEDGSKVLLVMYDESEGTGKGYDLLYADLNFDGKFEQGESSRKTHHPYMSRTRALPAGWEGWAFSPISLNVPFNQKGEGVPDPCRMTFRYQRYPTMSRVLALGGTIGPSPSPRKIAEVFEVRSEIRLHQDSTAWEYSFEGNMKPSESLESAPVWRFDDRPKIEIATRPDGRTKGNLGIALNVPAGERRFECKEAGQPPKAHVQIKKPDGIVVHEGGETLDKFRFG